MIIMLKRKRTIRPVELEKALGRGDISLLFESPACEFWETIMGQL